MPSTQVQKAPITHPRLGFLFLYDLLRGSVKFNIKRPMSKFDKKAKQKAKKANVAIEEDTPDPVLAARTLVMMLQPQYVDYTRCTLLHKLIRQLVANPAVCGNLPPGRVDVGVGEWLPGVAFVLAGNQEEVRGPGALFGDVVGGTNTVDHPSTAISHPSTAAGHLPPNPVPGL